MNEFDEQLARLRRLLGATEDQEVAAALGMTKAAFSARKRRGAFPRDKLLALKASQPALDVDYVLTGVPRLRPAQTAGDSRQRNSDALAELGGNADPLNHVRDASRTLNQLVNQVGFAPPLAWATLLHELLILQDIRPRGVWRVLETLKSERESS